MCKIFISFAIPALILIQACGYYGKSPFKDTDFRTANISSKITAQDNGYGYEIWVDGKLYITQRYLPDVKPYKRFLNQNDAQKVANLVVEKLRKNNVPPSVKRKELVDLGVLPENE
jgi:hypothetical protein